MNILLLTSHLNTGGVGSYVLTLASSLERQGVHVHVASAGGDLLPRLDKTGIPHHRFPLRLKSDLHPVLFWLVPAMCRLVRSNKIDLIHAQTRVTQMLAAMVSRITGIPYVTTCHGYFTPHLGRRLLPLWGKRAIAISRPVQEHLCQDLGLPPERITVIPHGIDLSRFSPVNDEERLARRARYGIPPEAPVAGLVARFSDVKGHRFLVAAMAEVVRSLPSARCLLFGQGPEEPRIRDLIRSTGLEKTIFLHPVVDRPAAVLPLLDLFVLPSVSEGLGLSILEAAAMGLPAVATRVGGIPDIVEDGNNGLLVPPRNPAALAAAMLRLLSDKALRDRMGTAACAFVRQHHDAERMAGATARLYQDILSAQPPGREPAERTSR